LMLVPRLLETHDHILSTTGDVGDTKFQLAEKITNTLEQLHKWRFNLIEEISKATGIELQEADALSFLKFGMDIAHCMLLFWGACLNLVCTLQVLKGSLRTTEWISTFQTCVEIDLDRYASNIVEYAHIFLAEDAGIVSCLNVSWAIGVAQMYCGVVHEAEPPQFRQAQVLMSDNGKEHGYARLLGTFLRNMHTKCRTNEQPDEAWEAKKIRARQWYRMPHLTD
jgi:hypothetical protein